MAMSCILDLMYKAKRLSKLNIEQAEPFYYNSVRTKRLAADSLSPDGADTE